MTHETSQPAPETAKSQPTFDAVIARHAAYYDIASEMQMFGQAEQLPESERPAAIEEMKSKLGHLTEEGHEQAKQLGLDILHDALAGGDPVDITFIPSKQEYESPRYPEAPWGGRRAVETAAEAVGAVVDEVQRLVAAGEITPDRVRVATPLPEVPFEEGKQPHHQLVERDVYYSPLSKVPLVGAYKKRAEEIIQQEQEQGHPLTDGYDTLGQVAMSEPLALSNREKEIWTRGQEDLDKMGNEIGNETSTDVSERIMGVVRDMSELARIHQERSPDRRLVTVMVAHDAVVSALSHKGFGTKPVIPTFARRLNIHVEDGVANMEYDGKIYPKRLTPSEQ